MYLLKYRKQYIDYESRYYLFIVYACVAYLMRVRAGITHLQQTYLKNRNNSKNYSCIYILIIYTRQLPLLQEKKTLRNTLIQK